MWCLTHPGADVQRSAGRDRGSAADREVPDYRQLDRRRRVQESPPLPLEGAARRHRGGGLRQISGGVLPGEQM